MHAPQERLGRCLSRWREARALQSFENEKVDRIARPRLVFHHRQRWPFDGRERPVPLVIRALRDPAPQQFLLRGREMLVRFWRRHHLIAVGRFDPRHQFALPRLAGHDGRVARLRRFQCLLAHIQPQLRLALLRIRPMTRKTIVRKNRQDIAIERDLHRNRRFGCASHGGGERNQNGQGESRTQGHEVRIIVDACCGVGPAGASSSGT